MKREQLFKRSTIPETLWSNVVFHDGGNPPIVEPGEIAIRDFPLTRLVLSELVMKLNTVLAGFDSQELSTGQIRTLLTSSLQSIQDDISKPSEVKSVAAQFKLGVDRFLAPFQ